MDIFNYDNKTGEYLSQSVARQNPLNKNKFLIPADSTKKIPPNVGVNEKAVFDINLDDWVKKQDFRKETYYSKSDGSIINLKLGESPDLTMQKTLPVALKAIKDEEKRISDIHLETESRITKLFPINYNFLMRDNNFQSRLNYLQRKEYKGTATASEIAELDNSDQLWIKLELVMTMSEDAKTNNDSLITFISDLNTANL